MVVRQNKAICGILHQRHYATVHRPFHDRYTSTTSRSFFVYSIGGCYIFILQMDAIFFNGDQSFLVEVADGLFECLFTDTKKVGDDFGTAFIGNCDIPILLLQLCHNIFGQGIDGFVAGFL